MAGNKIVPDSDQELGSDVELDFKISGDRTPKNTKGAR
jgi:hypothetical protein